MDLRLVPVALACWLMAAAIILTRSSWPLAFGSVVTVMSVAGWLYLRRSLRGRPWRMLPRSVAVVGATASTVGLGTWLRILLIDAQLQLRNLSSGTGSVRESVSVAGLPKQVAEGTVMVPVNVHGLGEVPLFLRPDLAEAGNGTLSDFTELQPGMSFDIAATARPSQGAEMLPITP